jgi:hypothetical protein
MSDLFLLLAVNAIVALPSMTDVSVGQGLQVYEHPSLNIQFQATANWHRVPRPEDATIYEVADPTGAVHVVLWYTTTEQDSRSYLMKMASMKDVQLEEDQEASLRRIDGHEAWVLDLPGRERGARVRTLLAVIPHGKSRERPRENALYLVQIWCPEGEYQDYRRSMEGILETVEITQEDKGEALPSLLEVLQRYVEVVGGREAIRRLSTRVMMGRLVTDLPSRQPPVHESNRFSIYAKVPDRYLVVQQSETGAHRDGCDGEMCWSATGSDVQLDTRCDRRFAWFVDPRGALRLREYFPEMKLQGVTTLQGRSTYRVDIDDDPSHALYFDAETGLMVRLGYNRELSDYREVDGVRVPFRLAISRKGGSSTYVFEKIEHNVPLDDARFVAAVPY